jgi:hypothetical protein
VCELFLRYVTFKKMPTDDYCMGKESSKKDWRARFNITFVSLSHRLVHAGSCVDILRVLRSIVSLFHCLAKSFDPVELLRNRSKSSSGRARFVATLITPGLIAICCCASSFFRVISFDGMSLIRIVHKEPTIIPSKPAHVSPRFPIICVWIAGRVVFRFTHVLRSLITQKELPILQDILFKVYRCARFVITPPW